jgi:hypothetical protein
MRTGRRIDGELTKLIVAFRNFENAPKNNLGSEKHCHLCSVPRQVLKHSFGLSFIKSCDKRSALHVLLCYFCLPLLLVYVRTSQYNKKLVLIFS